MLIGMLSGIITTALNTRKRSLNSKGVIDSLGSIFLFLIPSALGGAYSAILFATSEYGPLNDQNYRQADGGSSRWRHGGMQMAGLGITIGIGLVFGAIIGLFMKFFNTP